MPTGITGITDLSLIMENDVLKYIISIDSLGATQIWDWSTHTKIGDPITDKLKIIGFDVKTNSIIYLDSGGGLIQWKLDLDHSEWQELLCQQAKRNFTQEEWDLYFPGEQYPTKDMLTCPKFEPGN